MTRLAKLATVIDQGVWKGNGPKRPAAPRTLQFSNFTKPADELASDLDVWLPVLNNGTGLDLANLPRKLQVAEVEEALEALAMLTEDQIPHGDGSIAGSARMTVPDSPRILIARMSAIGDTILTLPVACALRASFPRAFLAWVVEQKSAAMVLGHPCLDEVLVLPRGWFTSPRGLWAARQALRALRVDTTLDCQGLTKSALACRLSGARQRIGLRGEHGRELSSWLNNQLIDARGSHVVDRSLELLAPLGIQRPVVQWQLPIDDAARQRMRDAVVRLGLTGRYAVINPGATWDSRLWEMDRFGSVAQYLGVKHGLPTLVVWGGARERAAAEQIVAASGGHAVLAPPSTLIELAALIEGGRLFLSADTGPLHMAVAVGTPSIGLCGPTRPEDSGPYGSPHVALQVEYQGGSHKERRRADNRAMRLITVDMVCTHCDALLGSRGAEVVR